MKTIHEDLTNPDEAPAAGNPPPASVQRQWQRWVIDAQTKERRLETYELLPYKRSIEDLWHRLCADDVPLRGVGTESMEAWCGASVKLLYLLSHAPHEYRHLRGSPELFIEAIEAWGDENVPREKSLDAVSLALSIHNGAYAETAAV